MNASQSSASIIQFLGGGLAVFALVAMVRAMFRAVTIEAVEGTQVLVTRFGKLHAILKEPGLHFFPWKAIPGHRVLPVSVQRDCRHYSDIHVNDCRGTSVIVDLWVEFRVVNPARALFHIEDWEKSLQSLLTHAATSILGTREFSQILRNRTELATLLKEDVKPETSRWGLQVEEVFIRQVSLLPEVSRQMFEMVAARLERAKADIEEEGRLQVAQMDAETSAQVAALEAEAKGQYPAAVGRAYEALACQNQEVFEAYRELHALSLVRPHRTVAFHGFAPAEVSALDAAMTASGSFVSGNAPELASAEKTLPPTATI